MSWILKSLARTSTGKTPVLPVNSGELLDRRQMRPSPFWSNALVVTLMGSLAAALVAGYRNGWLKRTPLVQFLPKHADRQIAYLKNQNLQFNELATTNQTGISLYHAKQYDTALDHFHKIAQIYPHDSSVLFNIAMVYKRKGELETAKTNFDHALQADQKNAAAHNQLGEIALTESNWEKALLHLNTANLLDASLADPLLNLGRLYERTGRWDIAISFYEKYLNHPAAENIAKPLLRKRLRKLSSLAKYTENQRGST